MAFPCIFVLPISSRRTAGAFSWAPPEDRSWTSPCPIPSWALRKQRLRSGKGRPRRRWGHRRCGRRRHLRRCGQGHSSQLSGLLGRFIPAFDQLRSHRTFAGADFCLARRGLCHRLSQGSAQGQSDGQERGWEGVGVGWGEPCTIGRLEGQGPGTDSEGPFFVHAKHRCPMSAAAVRGDSVQRDFALR